MEYIIFDKNQVLHKNVAQELEKTIAEKVHKLERYFRGYRKPVRLEVHLAKAAHGKYTLSFLIQMRSKPVYIHATGENILLLAIKLLAALEEKIHKQRQKERKDYLYKRKLRQDKNIREHLQTLSHFKQEDNPEAFVYLLESITPHLKNYLKRRMQLAEQTAQVELPRIEWEELMSEFYLRIFEQFDYKPDEPEKLAVWLYLEADALLKEKLRTVQFEQDHLVSLEEIMQTQLQAMEEPFTVGADGKPMLVEELEDMPAEKMSYEFLLAEEPVTASPWEGTDKEEFARQVETLLSGLTPLERSVLDLYARGRKTPEQIARTKHLSAEEVTNIIEQIKSQVRGFTLPPSRQMR